MERTEGNPVTADRTSEQRLIDLGIDLPTLLPPGGNYLPVRRDGNTLYIAGQGPRRPDGSRYTGRVGGDVSAEDAYAHARLAGLSILALARAETGSLDGIRALKVFGMVNAVPGFAEHAKVINGCSDIFVEILGEDGKHARSAVGMGSLPGNMTVEIEAVFRITSRD
ncbi:hypothetical protein C2I36_05145 [Rhodobacteraceae bacterium WD3A24]|nr:hypothetical protein C2I36_05145 [Rhodobacteraceae bacterium WD3A24]